ncbi:MAG: hypothetical protein NC489_08200 [Ruminococcus flavefaciens]|nr:hypothetical protein [Ruminococcus flavefaciens]
MKFTDEQIQEMEANKKKIYARMKEVRDIIDTTNDSTERQRQQGRLKVLRDMYRDIVDQLEEARPPQEKKRKTPPKRQVRVDALGFDFFERCGSVWSDMEGRTWNEFSEIVGSGSASQASALMNTLKSALEVLTPTQYECIISYYMDHKTMVQIADERQVTKSTVSRCIKAGLRRIETRVIASLSVQTFLTEDGFDFMGFAGATEVLTERQREMLYFLLTDHATMFQIASYLNLCKSSISRTWSRICDNLSNVSSGIVDHPSARRISYLDWINRAEKEIAEELGISPAVYYRRICRDEMVGPLTRYEYEIVRLRDNDVNEAAEWLGIRPATIKKYWKKYADIDISGLPVPEPYIPRKIRDRMTINVRSMISSARSDISNTIGDNIDSKTYQRLMELSNAK